MLNYQDLSVVKEINVQQPQQSIAIDSLNKFVENHPFWNNKLFTACLNGELSREDFAYIFAQYYLYSKNFTRYIAGVMANCEQDNFRAKLTQNLWEESGEGSQVSHAQIFRNFLKTTFELNDLHKINFAEFTVKFVETYLENSLGFDAIWGSAWLSLGTEGIVSRMYEIMVRGMRQARIPNEELEFFHIHIACDDEHAETLSELMCSYADRTGWFETCKRAADEALSLRANFFDQLYENLVLQVDRSVIQPIKDRKSLAIELSDISALKSNCLDRGTEVYQNEEARFNIKFTVDRLAFPTTQVLDPRIVRIPPGKNNERHRHAHEAVFYIIQGSGYVSIDDRLIKVNAGDTVFIPRWCIHQSQNTGDVEMHILAVTDFGLTSKVLGNYDRKTRLKIEKAV
jgi:mannose-6-phosphate isomerase-like protein (cupin superfamily)/pyrroloquinoline quinone (PQQ) biosynthesis protein C